jgi:hypothetical protein
MSDFITPTVGRVVWFYPSRLVGESGFASPPEGEPLAAVIARVWNDRMVNLTVFDANGAPHPRTSVPLVQDDQLTPRDSYCTWMPFQKGQARAQAAAQTANSVASDACKAQSAEPAATPLAINKRVNDALKAATTGAALPRPSRREQLEAELVAGAARVLAENPNHAKDLAEGIKDFLNVLHPLTPLPNPQAGVLYQAIYNAMGELGELHPGFNDRVNRAWNYLHRAFWSESPAPASAPGLRDELLPAEPGVDLSPTKQQDVGRQYRKKPVVITAITFDELVQHGRDSGANIVAGMPWSFTYAGQSISHENDDCYLIPTLEGVMKMGRADMLITGVKGEIYPCKADIFAATYDPA